MPPHSKTLDNDEITVVVDDDDNSSKPKARQQTLTSRNENTDRSTSHSQSIAEPENSVLVSLASSELESMKQRQRLANQRRHCRRQHCEQEVLLERFPPACLHLLRTIRGNMNCADCNQPNPDWASVSYGCMICLKCSGRHRGLGVKVSVVRSITMDHWSHDQILSMLEGGNKQLLDFFRRHNLCQTSSTSSHPILKSKLNDSIKDDITTIRYKTKAALFYRTNLAKHATFVRESGTYGGRGVSRCRHYRRNKTEVTTKTTKAAPQQSPAVPTIVGMRENGLGKRRHHHRGFACVSS